VDLKPACREKIEHLIRQGVDIPNPPTLDIGAEVNVSQISGKKVKIYPGCRIYGEKTVISAGDQIGYEGPVTLHNCQLGPDVSLKGGYFHESVFLEKSNMGLGAHIREGCILEEEANGAHCVGLKQTILFPFVTLGSLINFCDCFMAGGTSRKDHSEVGSSYIHFNFTPDGDKTTPSLVGDVPRGVMLRERPIFLGGQGGMVGPLRIGYGNVVAAGTILRKDADVENKLLTGKSPSGGAWDFLPGAYPGLSRILENNIYYIANLTALEQWYIHVRWPFFEKQEFGRLVFHGGMEKLRLGMAERIRRLKDMAGKVQVSLGKRKEHPPALPGKEEFSRNISRLEEFFGEKLMDAADTVPRDRFLAAVIPHLAEPGGNYVETIRSLPAEVAQRGTAWLDSVVKTICREAAEIFPALKLFKKIIPG
jgi:bifunctional UDP-N-acetylglucosamine pyrophosphorylase / glucosamine-1-phosphate N-acetyltransferase